VDALVELADVALCASLEQVSAGLAWVFCLKKPLAGLAAGCEVEDISLKKCYQAV